MKCDKYFLGGASPNGFKTRFGAIISDTDYYTYIIKGGPGTGKSSLMKRMAEAFPDEDKEFYYCSSDPDSVDAVLFKESKVIFVDGTSPHVFDAEYAGAAQRILDLGQFWDTNRLRSQRDDIIEATKNYLQYHERCKRFITAMASIVSDTVHNTTAALNTDKLDAFTGRLSKKLFPKKSDSDVKGNVIFKQLSALTPKGYMTNIPENTTIYLLNDNYLAGADVFLRGLADEITQKGYDIEVSICTIMNESSFEHIKVPELNLAFISSTPINNISLALKSPINFKRFYDKNLIHGKKSRLKFNASAVKNLEQEAVCALVCAKEAHDILEKFYIDSVDFDSVTRLSYSLISEIKSM